MESCTFIQDKLREWNLGELIQRFEDEQINNKTFLSLDTSDRLEVLIPKIGPRVKFKKRLKEYKQSLNRQDDEEMMETTEANVDQALDQEMAHHETFPSQSLTSQRGILATQLFILRHHVADRVEDDLMTLFKSFIPNFIPDSVLKNDKIKVYKRKGLFLFRSLKDLLKDTLENYGLKLLTKTINCEDEIDDIMAGKTYQKLIRNKELADDDITLLWNCDAAPIEKNSIWPLQFTINELPYQIRQQNVLVPALWCGTGTPNMTELLMPFIDECCELAKTPLRWRDSNGVAHDSRVFALVCSSDAVARPLLRNSVQYNGEYGCDWCLHPGTMVDKGLGKIRSYAYNENKQEARCEEMHANNASIAKASNPIHGVKGLSVLQKLPVFEIVQGFVPEYSHAVLLGVTKQLVFLWLEEKNSTESWYVGNTVDELDKRLLKLRPDLKITRRSLSLKYRDSWKAVDWQAFLLFYGVYVLQPYLGPPYFLHFCLLSCSIHMLLQDSITQESLNCAQNNLERFVKDMSDLYGEEHVTFNCHQLIHLCDSVQNWGPLWATSALGFEKNNKDLQALLLGVINNSEGIVKKFSIWQNIPNHLRSFVFDKLEFNDLMNLNSPQNVCKATYTPLGHFGHLDISDSVRRAVQDLLKDTGKRVSAYECFTNGHRVYHCANSKDADKTKCTVKLQDGDYGEIHFLLRVKCMCTSDCLCRITLIFVAKMFNTNPIFQELNMGEPAETIFVKGRLTEQFRAFSIRDIKSECVCVNGWIVPLPNTHERY